MAVAPSTLTVFGHDGVLEERGFAQRLVNAAHLKIVPGRKSDLLTEWIAALLAHGLLQARFVLPEVIGQRRNLTRYCKRLVQSVTAEFQRIDKVLEDGGHQARRGRLGHLDRLGARDAQGLGGRQARTRGPRRAVRAKGRVSKDIRALQQALRARFGDLHAFMIGMALDHAEYLEAAIGRLDAQVDALFAAQTSEAGVPFTRACDRLATILGVGKGSRIYYPRVG